MSKIDAKNQVRQNRILRALIDNGEMSVTNLARTTGMSMPMVIKQLGLLRKGGLVLDGNNPSSDKVGRPPIITRINGDAGCILGIDIGHRNTNYVLLNLQQSVVSEFYRPSADITRPDLLIPELTDGIEHVFADAGIPRSSLLGVGVSIPGIVRGREGRSETYLNFGEVPVRDILQERWKTNVLIEHDAKAMAMGEFTFGHARNRSNVLCVNIGWGLGLGVILDGKLLYGRDGYAGEFGHIPVMESDRKCVCGKCGCLESVASGRAIAGRVRELIAQGRDSILVSQNIRNIETEHIISAALGGDECALETLTEAGYKLGEGLAVLINLFNPEMVILGGRVSSAGALLLDPLREEVRRHALGQLSHNVEFCISTLGPAAGALGVAMLASHSIFQMKPANIESLV